MTTTTKTIHELQVFLTRGQAAQRAVDHALEQITAHGPGLTFGELAIGELFWWPEARGPEPKVKTSADRYEWSRGYGTAEAFYRVERYTPADSRNCAQISRSESAETRLSADSRGR